MSRPLPELLTLPPDAPVVQLVETTLAAVPAWPAVTPELPTGGPPGDGDEVLGLAARLDRGPGLLSVALTARMALSLYDAHQDWASGIADLEADHGHDTTQRALWIAEIAARLFAGALDQRAAALLRSPSGRALLTWFASVEVALAFVPVDDPLDDQAASVLVDAHDGSASSELPEARALLRALLPAIDARARDAARGAEAVATAIRAHLPALADRSRDELAAETERLPVYQLLVARLVAELWGPGAAASARGEAEAQAARIAADLAEAERIEAERIEAERDELIRREHALRTRADRAAQDLSDAEAALIVAHAALASNTLALDTNANASAAAASAVEAAVEVPRGALPALAARLAELDAAIEGSETALAERLAEADAGIATSVTLHASLQRCATSLESLLTELSGLTAERARHAALVLALEQDVAALRARIVANDTALAEAAAEAQAAREAEAQAAREAAAALAARVAAARDALAQVEEGLGAAQAELDGHATALAALATRLVARAQATDELHAEAEAIRREADARRACLARLQDSLAATEAAIAAASMAHGEADRAAAEAEAAREPLLAALRAHADACDAWEGRAIEAVGEQLAADACVAHLEDEVAELQGAIAANESALADAFEAARRAREACPAPPPPVATRRPVGQPAVADEDAATQMMSREALRAAALADDDDDDAPSDATVVIHRAGRPDPGAPPRRAEAWKPPPRR